jgi:hypothetical protein
MTTFCWILLIILVSSFSIATGFFIGIGIAQHDLEGLLFTLEKTKKDICK